MVYHAGRYKTQYKHFFQHPQNPEITASKGSQRVLWPRSARYRPSRLPWVCGAVARARASRRFAFSRSRISVTLRNIADLS